MRVRASPARRQCAGGMRLTCARALSCDAAPWGAVCLAKTAGRKREKHRLPGWVERCGIAPRVPAATSEARLAAVPALLSTQAAGSSGCTSALHTVCCPLPCGASQLWCIFLQVHCLPRAHGFQQSNNC